MCGISASFDLNTLDEMIDANFFRGNFSFSLLVYDVSIKQIVGLHKGFHDHRKELISFYKYVNNPNLYYISHGQAPTNGLIKDFNRVHPASINEYYLYHNGLLKNVHNRWDTLLLLELLLEAEENHSILDNIEGSFACILICPYIVRVFRNKNSIIYYDKNLNFSSVNYDNWMDELPANKMFNIDFKTRSLNELYSFKTCDDNYAIL